MTVPVLLYLEEFFPDPRRDTGSHRVCCLLSLFREKGWRIVLGVQQKGVEDTEDFQKQFGVEALLQGMTEASLREYCEQASGLRLVWSARPEGTSTFLPVLREVVPHVPVVYDTIDLHHIREYRHARYLKNGGLLHKSLQRKQQECALANAVEHVVLVSDHEKDVLQQLVPSAHLSTVAWSQELYENIPGWDSRSGLLFVGGFFNGASANAESMRWFLDKVWPLIQQKNSELCLWVVGGDVPAWLQGRASDQVQILGRVMDLQAMMDRVRVSVAPLQIGAGIKGKIIESWAMGVPVVATSIAAEGFPEAGTLAMKVQDDPQEFADAVLELHDQEKAWTQMSGAGQEVVRRYFSREVLSAQLDALLASCNYEGCDG
ncbi:glycosyltransferase family 4 protein [Kiritimatiellota bacterium B12222]|nr:glycosyltransferase family 4 protein [Kiritimatiellota bacterium B12222]